MKKGKKILGGIILVLGIAAIGAGLFLSFGTSNKKMFTENLKRNLNSISVGKSDSTLNKALTKYMDEKIVLKLNTETTMMTVEEGNPSTQKISGDFYLNNGNVYTEDPSNYDLIDVNSCNAVYMNGKNTQWKAFKTNPDRAFLYDLYSTIPIKTIKKNLLDDFNKPYVKMNKTNDNCFLNVMFENDMDKDIKVTDANSTILSLEGSIETFSLPRNTNNNR